MSSSRAVRPQPAGRRGGFVIGLVVFAGLMFMAMAIYPTLFFSGSQTRSEALSANRWRGRVLARSGLKLGASLLRKQRWWNTVAGNNAPSVGTKTSDELGVPATVGRFQLVAESIIGPYPAELGLDIPAHLLPDDASGGEPYNPLERVDLFVRAEIEDDTVVAYGAFVMSPRPRFHGQDSVMAGGSSRLVRVQFFTKPEFQEIEQVAVRQAIRDEIEAQADLFLTNYAVVNFRATPASEATGTLGDAQASAFMEQWVRAPGASPSGEFLRDRIYDVLFEGTPVGRRDDAREVRDLRAKVPSCDSAEQQRALAEAEFLCANDMEGDCTWFEPACRTPTEWDYDSDDAGEGETVLHLREADLDSAAVDDGYISRMAATEPILRAYEYSCDAVEYLDRGPPPPDADGNGIYEDADGNDDPSITWYAPSPSGAGVDLPADLWTDTCPAGDPNDRCFCVNPQASVEDPPSGAVAYVLVDEVTGFEQRLDEVANYFRRQLLDTGATVDSAGVSFHRYQTTDPPPVVEDDDDDGGGGGDGDGDGGGGDSGGGGGSGTLGGGGTF